MYIYNCIGYEYGGVIYLNKFNQLTIKNSLFIRFRASTEGSFLKTEYLDKRITFISNTFILTNSDLIDPDFNGFAYYNDDNNDNENEETNIALSNNNR